MEEFLMNNCSYKIHKTIECATRHNSGNYISLPLRVILKNYPKATFCGTCMKEYIDKFNLLDNVA